MSISTPRTRLYGLLLLAVGLAAGIALSQRSDPEPSAGADKQHTGAAAAEAIAASSTRAQPAARSADASLAGEWDATLNRTEAEPSLTELQTEDERRRREAEARFDAEPVSSTWSSRKQIMIADAFSADTLAGNGAPAPRIYDAQCRSRTCRIELVYDSEVDAETGVLFLLSHIGGELGYSTPFQNNLSDGSMYLVLYSTANRVQPTNLHGH